MNAPEGGLYRPLVLSVALFLVASGVLLAIQMISTIVGPFRISEIGAHDPRVVVALWRPIEAIAGASLRGPFGHELVESGRAVREVAALDGLDPARVGAIVLTEPRALGADDLAALDAYVAAGGGAVLVGSVAVRGRDGAWRGYEAMQRLLGAKVVLLEEGGAKALVAARRGPLSAPLLPRERIEIAFEPGTPGVLADDAELRWSGAAAGPAAALRRTQGKGRLVWLAATPERAVPAEADRRRARRVLEAAVAWVSRTPTVEVLPWPHGAAFASVVQAGEIAGSAEPQWRRAIEAARRDAGLAELRVPADAHARDALQPALSRTLGALAAEKAWVAQRGELAEWVRMRAVVDASVRRMGPRRLVVEVTNRAGAALDGLVLRVHLNETVLGARATGTKVLQQAPDARLLPDGQALDLGVPRLAARTSAAYSLDLEPTPAGERWGNEG